MAKLRHGRFFRFPLSLLTYSNDRGELAQHIASHTVVMKGWGRITEAAVEALGDVAGNPNAADAERQARLDFGRGVADWMCTHKPGDVPADFDASDLFHLSALVAVAPAVDFAARNAGGADDRLGGLGIEMKLGSCRATVERYERAEQHVRAYAAAVGNRGKMVDAGASSLWALNKTDSKGRRLSVREFRVLVAIRAGIDGKRFNTIASDALRYLADGCSNRPAFLSLAGAAPLNLDAEGAVSAEALVEPPKLRGESQGIYGYARALGLYHVTGLEGQGIAFTGEAGAFDVLPTARGVLFALRAEYAALATSRIGRLRVDDLFSVGQRVVYIDTGGRNRGARGILRTAVVESVEKDPLAVSAAGVSFTVSRADQFVTPADLVPGLSAEAVEGGDTAAETLPEPTWTGRMIRATRDHLHRLGFFAYVPLGRSGVYSTKLKQADLENAVAEREEYKLTAAHTRRMAGLSVKERVAMMKAAHDAEFRAASERSVGVRSASARSDLGVTSASAKTVFPLQTDPERPPIQKESVAVPSPPRQPPQAGPHAAGTGTMKRAEDRGPSTAAPLPGTAAALFGAPAILPNVSPGQSSQRKGVTEADLPPEPDPPRGGSPLPVPTFEADAPTPIHAAHRPLEGGAPAAALTVETRPEQPPAGALDSTAAFRRQMELGDPGPLYGLGGMFEQIVTADFRGWYVERDRGEVSAERARLAAGKAPSASTG